MRTGNFGKVREAYAEARQLFPAEVFDYLWSHATANSPHVLDLGCGTGIATRQLSERDNAIVIGCDADEEMIEEAQRISSPLSYFVAQANKLPFDVSSFDMVTAFSAFHWFRDDESLAEIKRVLKPDGVLGVVNKNDVGGFRVGYREKLEWLLGKKIISPKQDYDPAEILKKSGLIQVQEKSIMTEEVFDLDSALKHIQSASVWGEVPDDKQAEANHLMRQHILDAMIDGRIVRQLDVKVVTGILPSV